MLPFVHLPPALRHRNYTLLWLGLLLSMAGSQMQLTTLLWHLRLLSDQPVVVSGIGLVRVLPIIILSPFAGLAADRINRRMILVCTQSIMIFVSILLALLTYMQIIQVWQIYLLTAIQSLAAVFDMPSRMALIPNLVPKEDLPSAFSMQSIAFNTGAIVGPGVSGIIIGYFGIHYVYMINALSFAAVLVALFMMGNVFKTPEKTNEGFRANLLSIGEGFSFIRHQPLILSSMLLDFVATFFSSANTLLPFVARDVLHVGEIQYGWLASAQPIGAVATGLFFSQRTRIHNQGKMLITAVLCFGIATAFFGVVNTFWWAMLALILIGSADTVSTIIRNTLRQLQTPDYIRGRMVGVNQIFFSGGPQLGEMEAGLVAQLFGIPFAIISGGVGCIIGAAALAFVFPQLIRYRGDEVPAHETGGGV